MNCETTIDPKIIQITNQYQQVAGGFCRFFEALSPRTSLLSNLWRSSDFLNGKYSGTGDCKQMNRSRVIQSFAGVAETYLTQLADQRNADMLHPTTASDCTYHGRKGCVLDDLRPPLCLSHVSDQAELKERFNIYGDRLPNWIRETLEQVMLGGTDKKDVEAKVYQIDQLTAYISTFPILSEAEQLEDRLQKYADFLKKRRATHSSVV